MLLEDQHEKTDDHKHDHSHHKETGGQRFCKLITLLAGLYTAELLRFV